MGGKGMGVTVIYITLGLGRSCGDWGKGKAEEDSAKVQIGAELLWKGEKVNTKQGGAWQDRLQSTDYRLRRKGRGVASPRPPMVEDKAKPCPYPRAELARGS